MLAKLNLLKFSHFNLLIIFCICYLNSLNSALSTDTENDDKVTKTIIPSTINTIDILDGDIHPNIQPELIITPFSTEIGERTVRTFIESYLEKATQRIVLASDQFTDQSMAAKLNQVSTKSDMKVHIVTGDNLYASSETKSLLTAENITCKEIPEINGNKMHNKFLIIDDAIVISGSANATFNAYENNIESMVAIEDQNLSNLYYTYYTDMVAGNPSLGIDTRIQKFNYENQRVNVCLAPIFNISEFIKNEIKGATAIHINMFLVSRGKNKSADLIKSLADAAKKGASISLMIDGGRYTALAFMQKAISDLKILAPAVRVTTVYMHQGCTISYF